MDGIRGTVSWKPIVEHLSPMTRKEVLMSTCHKITRQHLWPKGYDRMKVKYATQIFSNGVAASMQNAIDRGLLKHEYAQMTVRFIWSMDALFDILNSSKSSSNMHICRRALVHDDPLILVLREALNVLTTMEFVDGEGNKKKERVHCIDMFKQTINGVIHLSQALPSIGIKYLFTRRLGTDSVENYFSQHKRLNRNLTTRTFKASFRASMIANSFNVTGANCEADLDENPLNLQANPEDSDFSDSESYATDFPDDQQDIVQFFNSFDPYLENDLGNFFSKFDPLSQSAPKDFSSSAYYAGYILKRLKAHSIGCDSCLGQLTSLEPQNIHSFIKLKEYSDEPTSLQCASVDFIEWLDKVIAKLGEYIPNSVFTLHLKYNMVKLFENWTFIMVSCHAKEIKMHVLKFTINTMLDKYLRNVRNSQKLKFRDNIIKKRQVLKRKPSTTPSAKRQSTEALRGLD